MYVYIESLHEWIVMRLKIDSYLLVLVNALKDLHSRHHGRLWQFFCITCTIVAYDSLSESMVIGQELGHFFTMTS